MCVRACLFPCLTATLLQSPEWNDKLDVWEAHSSGGHLEVQVWDDDRMRGDDHIASAMIDVGRTLLATNPCPQQDAPDCVLYPALPPEDESNGAAPAAALLPPDEIVTREALLVMPTARHRRGTPRVFLRLTWVPVGMPAPWSGERQGSPLVPWRPTELQAMQGLVPASGAAPPLLPPPLPQNLPASSSSCQDRSRWECTTPHDPGIQQRKRSTVAKIPQPQATAQMYTLMALDTAHPVSPAPCRQGMCNGCGRSPYLASSVPGWWRVSVLRGVLWPSMCRAFNSNPGSQAVTQTRLFSRWWAYLWNGGRRSTTSLAQAACWHARLRRLVVGWNGRVSSGRVVGGAGAGAEAAADELPRTLSMIAAAEVRRGRLEVTVREVPGGAAASRYPKYVSMRHNRVRLGKTNRTFHCRFNFTAPLLDNASVDDVLQARSP